MTEDSTSTLFLEYSSEKLSQLSGRIDACLTRLNDDQLWTRGSDRENAIGNLVLHVCGNIRQWIISNIGGEPDIRRRDEEFSSRTGITVLELREALNSTVTEAKKIIEAIGPDRLAERVTIQGFDVSTLEAVYHVVEHFSMHTGQIIYASKSLVAGGVGLDWQSDLIP